MVSKPLVSGDVHIIRLFFNVQVLANCFAATNCSSALVAIFRRHEGEASCLLGECSQD